MIADFSGASSKIKENKYNIELEEHTFPILRMSEPIWIFSDSTTTPIGEAFMIKDELGR